jgi:hypothetical protein
LRENFPKVKFQERLIFNFLIVIHMKDSGKITKLMDSESTNIIQVLFTKGIGRKICNLALGFKSGWITASIKDHT